MLLSVSTTSLCVASILAATPLRSGKSWGAGSEAGWLEALIEANPGSPEHRFLLLLRQVAVEFDAFGGSSANRQPVVAHMGGYRYVGEIVSRADLVIGPPL